MIAPNEDLPDENVWLEDIHGERPLAWAAEQSARTLAQFASPEFDELTGRLLEVIDSDERIPLVSRRGEFLYNFWRDRSNPRGLWRRTTLESYRSPSPSDIEWDVLLDVDALGRAEDTEWVFAGASLLPNDYSRALVSLSPDGGDADTVREFDLVTREFVADGFVIPTAKSSVGWIDRDSIFVGTDFGPGTMTESSYPRTVRRLRRGQQLDHAELIHEVSDSDLTVSANHISTPGFERDVVTEVFDFYRSRSLLLIDDALVPLELPEDADSSIRRGWLLVQPRSDWTVGGVTHATGSLLVIDLEQFLAGDRTFTVLFAPTQSVALSDWSWTESRLVLELLDNVASRIVLVDPADGWSTSELPGVPTLSTVHVVGTDPDHSDQIWLYTTGFTSPPALLRGVLGSEPLATIRSSPAFFDASDIEVQQHWVVSADGTRVPYFQVAARGLELDGSHPTFINGYGGFQSPILAAYNGVVGRAWLDRGGVFVVANIRGGGEFGPAWHTSVLKQNRPRAYEDFAAVARDLVTRGVTVPARLGCEGRSNGGLLVGNMLVSYPDLFGAVVCGVPLLDMKRYTHLSAGASWIAEYGDPDVPGEWEFIRTFSPYQLLQEGRRYPSTFLYAATSDDRVGPVQARKMAERMQSMAIPDVLYFENTDGGHGGAVDNTHTARLYALMYDFLWRRLAG